MLKTEKLEKVVDGGFCVGCGACSYLSNTSITLNEYGEYAPDLKAIENSDAEEGQLNFACPSLNPEFNEDVLADKFLNCENKSDHIGPYESIYGGFVSESNFRSIGTSGGFGTWIGYELLKNDLIDGVIHAKSSDRSSKNDPFFKYSVSQSLQEIKEGSKTKYHVIEMSSVLHFIKQNPGRYLFIGLPCMIKTIRRIQLVDDEINKSISYTASLVCGHLKSVNWTLSLAWSKGILPEQLNHFQYRTKAPGISARAYYFTAFGENGETVLENSASVVGGKFNQGALMLPACNFCDDVVGEVADITIGDAWLPKYYIDSEGTNLLIIRNKVINSLLKNARESNRISLDELTESEAVESQSGGFRQRRDGLSYRLSILDRKGAWLPDKRIKKNQIRLPFHRKMVYKKRFDVTIKSREYFREALLKEDYSYYESKMNFTLKILRLIEVFSSLRRILFKRVESAFLKLKSKL